MLDRAVRSVLAQTFTDFELIVVDDGSTDDTDTVLGAFEDPRLVCLRHEYCRGAAVARNTGVAAAQGKWLAFQDSDDVWRIDKLKRQLSVIAESPHTGLVCCGYLVMTRSGDSYYLGADTRMQHGEWSADNIYDFRFITPTWLLSREVYDSSGGFDETMPNLEDWEFAFRLYQSTSIRVVDEPLVIKYGSPDSINPNRESRIQSLELIIQRHGPIWSTEPKVLARLWGELGHLQCLTGKAGDGRKNLARAVRLHNSSYKYWAKWGISLLGASAYTRLLKPAS